MSRQYRFGGRPLRCSRGQAVAEFMVVVPLLLLILAATVGFGHLIFTKMIVVQAANRAARLGATLYGDSTIAAGEAHAQTRQAALSVLSASLTGSDREVIVSQSGSDVRVTVRYRRTTFVPLMRPWLGASGMVEHQAVYRVEKDRAR